MFYFQLAAHLAGAESSAGGFQILPETAVMRCIEEFLKRFLFYTAYFL